MLAVSKSIASIQRAKPKLPRKRSMSTKPGNLQPKQSYSSDLLLSIKRETTSDWDRTNATQMTNDSYLPYPVNSVPLLSYWREACS